MALAYPISVLLDPGSLPVGNIYEFAMCEILSIEMECFSDASRSKFAPLFAKIPIYYDRDCLQKYKMSISTKLGGRSKIFLTFS